MQENQVFLLVPLKNDAQFCELSPESKKHFSFLRLSYCHKAKQNGGRDSWGRCGEAIAPNHLPHLPQIR